MKAVMLSIRPEWCEKIALGFKTIEVRKSKPKLETPFKCYIYCTKDKHGHLYRNDTGNCREIPLLYIKHNATSLVPKGYINGKVIGEFVCDAILPISVSYSDPSNRIALREFPFTCLTDKQIMDYLSNGKTGYCWHIPGLVIYDKPKELREFFKPCIHGAEDISCFECEKSGYSQDMKITCYNRMERAPQSWCYVEGKS